MWRLACLLVGYVCGSVLFAEVVARTMSGTSIFGLGNGNPGMANTARSLGRTAALCCLAGDILKLVAAVLICCLLFREADPILVRGWAGIGATLGHMFPFWHGFRGGKGVTTLASTIVLIDWRGALLSALAAGASIALAGYLSIAAVVASGVFVVWSAIMLPHEAVALAACAFILALIGQWSNLWGIRDGSAKRDFYRN